MIGIISYLVFFTTVASILAIAVLGLNLHWGNTGLFNGGVVAFFGAGAYGIVILGGWGVPYLPALVGGMIIAGVLALIVGIMTLRLRHDYLAIATFGVAIGFENFVRNAEGLTGGAKGLRGFERPLEAMIGNSFVFNIVFLVFVLIALGAVYWFLNRLINSPFGRLLRAIREDEVVARSLGKSPSKVRLLSFVTGSMIMGLSGALYATFYAFISPQDVLPILTFQLWAMLIVGGSGNNKGALLGTFVIWIAWTGSGWGLAKFAPVEAQLYSGTIQYIIIGIIIVGTLLLRPQGLLPEKLVVSQSDEKEQA